MQRFSYKNLKKVGDSDIFPYDGTLEDFNKVKAKITHNGYNAKRKYEIVEAGPKQIKVTLKEDRMAKKRGRPAKKNTTMQTMKPMKTVSVTNAIVSDVTKLVPVGRKRSRTPEDIRTLKMIQSMDHSSQRVAVTTTVEGKEAEQEAKRFVNMANNSKADARNYGYDRVYDTDKDTEVFAIKIRRM